ncbi:MAG: hypothetical protein K6B28_09225 [Lachnospiraceae bacterium]|nr:hypothetical protein [Lachnospiraceae bacterium]
MKEDNKGKGVRALSDEELKSTNGGFLFKAENIDGATEGCPWEVINDKGEKIYWTNSQEKAEIWAKERNYGTKIIDWDTLCWLRGVDP